MAASTGEDLLGAYRRSVHPVRLEVLEAGGLALPFKVARGAWIEDARGRRHLDFNGGYGTAVLGHHPPAVMEALHGALTGEAPFLSPSGVSRAAGELAERLCALARTSLAKVYFGNSGSEGIEAALKLAMATTGRGVFLGFSEAFHGFTTGSLALCGCEPWRASFPALGVSALRAPFGDLDAAETWLDSQPIAGVVVEIVQGMAGARGWPAEKLRRLAELCRLHGALLIVDEVLTGGGRTGRWFAFQGAGLEPDIVVVSKALTGGVIPMCAVLMTDHVYTTTFRKHGAVHGSTFSANLLAMAAATAVLDALEQGALVERAATLSETFERRFEELQGTGLDGWRIHGFLMSLRPTDDLQEGELWGAPALCKRLYDRGVITQVAAQAPAWLNLLPPLNLDAEELEIFCERLEDALG